MALSKTDFNKADV